MAINDQRRLELYDRMSIWIEKGKREEFKQAADDFGLSLRELVQTSVETFIAEKSLQHLPRTPAQMAARSADKLSAEQKRLLDEFSKLPADAQKSLMKFLKTINDTSRKGGGENGDNGTTG